MSTEGMKVSLEEAQAEFRDQLDAGTKCPCCKRFAKRYRRKLNSSMASSLIALVGLSTKQLTEQAAKWTPGSPAPSAWVHANEVGVRMKEMNPNSRASYPHGEMGKLVHWGLIVEQPGRGDHARTTGYWQPTPYGIEFVNRTASVRQTVVLLDNVVEEFEGPEVKIDDVMVDHFDYRELMGDKAEGK